MFYNLFITKNGKLNLWYDKSVELLKDVNLQQSNCVQNFWCLRFISPYQHFQTSGYFPFKISKHQRRSRSSSLWQRKRHKWIYPLGKFRRAVGNIAHKALTQQEKADANNIIRIETVYCTVNKTVMQKRSRKDLVKILPAPQRMAACFFLIPYKLNTPAKRYPSRSYFLSRRLQNVFGLVWRPPGLRSRTALHPDSDAALLWCLVWCSECKEAVPVEVSFDDLMTALCWWKLYDSGIRILL